MRRYIAVCSIFASLLACSGPATKKRVPQKVEVTTPAGQLNAALDELWALNMRTFPGWATYEGVRDYDDRLEDLSDEAREAYLQAVDAIAAKVEAIDAAALGPVDRDTRSMVMLKAAQGRASLVCNDRWWDVNGLGGPQVSYLMMPVFFSIRGPDDLANLEKRYRATAAQIAQTRGHLERGVKEGYAPTKTNVGRALKQLDEYLESPIDGDPMLKLKDAEGKAVEAPATLRDAVVTIVRPALASYRDTLRNVVLPAARPDQGIADLPTGRECYAARINGHIGPGYTADGLHQRGLDELEVLRAGMVDVGRELGLKDPTAATVMEHFRSNKTYFATSEDELVEKNAEVVERAKAAMPRAFGRLPKTPIEMRPIEAHRAKDAPAAYYYGAPEDGSRPAYYYVNTVNPETRPLFNLEALAFHEAIPGHHQQIALAKEIPNVHIWRRSAGQTAFVEGWALYAEVLADELSLYTDAVTRFGMYNYQAWRAARLVIDTGLHHKGWTRKQAIDFLAANTALPIGEIENEIDRYIAWPGQALAYMVGRMKIQELRAASRRELGDAFSMRSFHDAVNANGAVPLTILEHNLTEWTAQMETQTSTLPDFQELWDFDDPPATRAKFTEVLELPATDANPTYRLQLLTQIARTHSLVGEFDDANRVLDEVVAELGDAEPVVHVRYLLERGRTFNSAKQKAERDGKKPSASERIGVEKLFIDAWNIARRGGLDGLAVDAAHMMGIVAAPADAIAWNERAMAYAEASDDPAAKKWLGALYNNMGWTYHDQKQFDRALALFEKGLIWREKAGKPKPTRVAKWAVGRALRSLDRRDEALKLQLELELAGDEAGEPDGFVYEEIGELLHAAGKKDEAKAYFAKAHPLLEKLGWVEAKRLARIKRLGGL